jgi:hypothetical protein
LDLAICLFDALSLYFWCICVYYLWCSCIYICHLNFVMLWWIFVAPFLFLFCKYLQMEILISLVGFHYILKFIFWQLF